ncbi:spindle assembly checkpoint component Mad1 [Irpex rosettiformis]|uniref:Spindle assembly checkpoint component Mad1 n=1 Tax=Irpex rosettiformis TaxID=378272 RepID=A0ACB8TXY6_9APHY|nr:spindle assembly checkpoint component Mad1 [Irpex rosettiformis]
MSSTIHRDEFSTPVNKALSSTSYLSRSSAPKRDSLAAELERDPQLSTAKRRQHTQAFTSHMAFSSLERQVMALQIANKEMETKRREKEVECDRLRGDVQFLGEKEKAAREGLEHEQADRESEKRRLENTIRTQRVSTAELESKYEELQDAYSLQKRNSDHIIAEQQARNSDLERRVQMLEEELMEFKNIAASRSQSIEELQNHLNDLSMSQDEIAPRAADNENWAVVRDELHRQADHFRVVENENVKMKSELAILRKRQANAEILKEENRELKRKAQGAEEAREQATILEERVKFLEENLAKKAEEWAAGNSAPRSSRKLEIDLVRVSEERDSAVTTLRLRDKELADAKLRLSEEQATNETMTAELEQLKGEKDRQQLCVQPLKREVEFLNAMLASYQTEYATEDYSTVDQAVAERTQHLDSLFAQYKAAHDSQQGMIQYLGEDLLIVGDGRHRKELLDENETLKAALTKAEQSLEEAEAEAEELKQTLFELGGEIGGGRHVPPGVRVLSLRDNPAQQWADLSQAVVDRLKNEIEALLKRIQDLENSGAVSDAGPREELVPRESLEAVKRENEDLKDLLKQRDKRLLRLQQVFTAKSEEFRGAIASILGVKLTFYPNGQVRVTSQFDLNAAFVFQPAGRDEHMRMQLVAQGDGGPQDLPQLMHYWVEQEQCIPGFLASVTLECYEKSKNEHIS